MLWGLEKEAEEADADAANQADNQKPDNGRAELVHVSHGLHSLRGMPMRLRSRAANAASTRSDGSHPSSGLSH